MGRRDSATSAQLDDTDGPRVDATAARIARVGATGTAPSAKLHARREAAGGGEQLRETGDLRTAAPRQRATARDGRPRRAAVRLGTATSVRPDDLAGTRATGRGYNGLELGERTAR